MSKTPGIVQVCQAHRLGTEDKKDYSYDFTPEMVGGETVSSFDIWANPSDLTIDNPGESAGIVSCQAANPRKAIRYDLWFRVTLSNGNIITANPIGIGGQERVKP